MKKLMLLFAMLSVFAVSCSDDNEKSDGMIVNPTEPRLEIQSDGFCSFSKEGGVDTLTVYNYERWYMYHLPKEATDKYEYDANCKDSVFVSSWLTVRELEGLKEGQSRMEITAAPNTTGTPRKDVLFCQPAYSFAGATIVSVIQF